MPYAEWPRNVVMATALKYPTHSRFTNMVDMLGNIDFSITEQRKQGLDMVQQTMSTNAAKLGTYVAQDRRFAEAALLVDVRHASIQRPLMQIKAALMFKGKDKDAGVRASAEMPSMQSYNDAQQAFLNAVSELNDALMSGEIVFGRPEFESGYALTWA